MVRAWRIVRAERAAEAFSGEGARRFGGRWNAPGTPMIYLSEHLSLAALETLVHLNPRVALRFKAFAVEIADAEIETLDVKTLPPDWRTEPPPTNTVKIGNTWAKKAAALSLSVPSAIVPQERNFLLNPRHPAFAKLQIGEPIDFSFDSRLLV